MKYEIQECGPRSRTRWSGYISDLACSRLGVEPAELSEIAVDREIFRVLGLFVERNVGMNINEIR